MVIITPIFDESSVIISPTLNNAAIQVKKYLEKSLGIKKINPLVLEIVDIRDLHSLYPNDHVHNSYDIIKLRFNIKQPIESLHCSISLTKDFYSTLLPYVYGLPIWTYLFGPEEKATPIFLLRAVNLEHLNLKSLYILLNKELEYKNITWV